MKKLITFISIFTIMFLFNSVQAEEIQTIEAAYQDYIPVKNLTTYEGCSDTSCPISADPSKLYYYQDFNKFMKTSKNKEIFNNLYQEILKYYKEKYPNTNYYMQVAILSDSSSVFKLHQLILKLVVVSGDDYYTTTKQPLYIMWDLGTTFPVTEKDYFGYEGSTSDRYYVNTLFNNGFTFRLGTGDYSSSWFLTPLNYFESTFDWKLAQTTSIFKAYTEANKLDYTLEAGDKVPPFRQPGTLTPTNYTTIDLNKYAYVLLNLKDYDKKKQFSTKMYVKGQLCLSSAYKYGTVEKSNGVTDICTQVYNDFSEVDVYILADDLKNDAIYYLSKYDSSIENKVKVDSNIFDITYITEENKNAPTITIDGKQYSVLPYDKLSSNANKNTESGNVPGASCKVGDLNCQASNSITNKETVSNIFTKPLEFFKNISAGFASFFDLINSFLSFLPSTLRNFMYFSFVLAVVLGIIKIIL